MDEEQVVAIIRMLFYLAVFVLMVWVAVKPEYAVEMPSPRIVWLSAVGIVLLFGERFLKVRKN